MTEANRILLGVNVDHVATLRQARGTRYPDPVKAALDAEEAGADGITVHLREDRRHIQERDVLMMKDALQTRMNFEMGVTEAMLAFAERLRPEHVCLVPETRQELTTEGGLDAAGGMAQLKPYVTALNDAGIRVSLFVEPDVEQLEAAVALGAPVIELHTGSYCDTTGPEQDRQFKRLADAAQAAQDLGLECHAGHGLTFDTVGPVAAINSIRELNIGHFLIGEAIFGGLESSIKRMRALVDKARADANGERSA